MTDAELARFEEKAAIEFAKYAKESVNVRNLKGTVYAFGSELATLRLFAEYNANGAHPSAKYRVGFSKGYDSHYFSIENDS